MSEVDVGSKDSFDRMALSYAAEIGNDAIVKLLLETGKVDAGSKDVHGRTPLLYAVERGNEASSSCCSRRARSTSNQGVP
jgi:ankyrin repeat protein